MPEMVQKTQSNYYAGIPTTETEEKARKRKNENYDEPLQSEAFL